MTTHHSKSKVAPAAPKSSTASTESTAAPAVNAIAPPPAGAQIPVVPSGFVPTSGAEFVAVVPRATEMAALPLAIQDLQKFTTYQQTLGGTAPALDQVLDSFTVAYRWSTMRAETAAWDGYCVVQEGVSWRSVRVQMDRLRPAFDLAVVGDPTITTQFAGLASFLGAKKVIAKKGVATRKANKEAAANGEAPFHGTSGKKRKKAAEKAALVATSTTAATATASTAAPVAATATPAATGTGATHS